jgi:chemotaxis protein MotB
LLALLAAELKTLPNALLIEGHTDAAPYSSDTNYGNWELSADRANSARRLMQGDGVRADQVTQVRGYADQLLRVKTNPYDPSNRRISILVKNSAGKTPVVPEARVVDGKADPVQSSGPPPVASQAAAVGPAGGSGTVAKTTPGAGTTPTKIAEKPGLMARIQGLLPGRKK